MKCCYVHVPGNEEGNRIGLLKFRGSGYYKTKYDTGGTDQHIDEIVLSLNHKLGVTQRIAESMLAGSMFGWSVPAAQEAIVHFSLLG